MNRRSFDLESNISDIEERLTSNSKIISESLANNIRAIINRTLRCYINFENYFRFNTDDTKFLKFIEGLISKTDLLKKNLDFYLSTSNINNRKSLSPLNDILIDIKKFVNDFEEPFLRDEKYIDLNLNLDDSNSMLSEAVKRADEKYASSNYYENKDLYSNEEYKQIDNAINKAKEFNNDYNQLKNRIINLNELATERITEIDTNFDSKIKELKEQLGEVESSIAKKALSASFLKRAEKLETESKWWLIASLVSILLFIGLAGWNFYKFTQITDLNFDSLNLHIRASIIYSPICISLFWSIWFCTKKYIHLCHLRDEYNYKHDLSESFIGYKNEVTFLDNLSNSDLKLFPILLSAVIQNICKSPLESNQQECHSPWSEIASLVFKKGKDKIDKETNI